MILRRMLPAVPVLVMCNAATAQDRALIDEGRRIFFEETFEGNGRTCGTCHPANHNFTIDPDFIATLPDDDPLFVAEFNPALANLENPTLMREFGLILENLDGFAAPPVFRGVPHNVGMTISITPDPEQPGIGERDAVGWSGDGAPGQGKIRDFLTGAITQHFPKTLARVPGVDFRLPTDEELDAVAAFMMSLGRTEDRDLASRTFADADVEAGSQLFQGQAGANRACTACHGNAGSNNDAGVNRNFDTGIRRVAVLDPGAFPGADLNPDGGFGQGPLTDPVGFENGVAGFGDGTFNTPSLMEAADTPPFFHDNSAATIEDAVAFYTGPIFAGSPGSFGAGPFNFTPVQVDQVAAFLRVLNSLENGRNSVVLSRQAQRLRGGEASARIIEVIAETEDAIEVLEGARVGFFQPAVAQLRAALSMELRALGTRSDARRNRFLANAQRLKFQASDTLTGRPAPSAQAVAAQ